MRVRDLWFLTVVVGLATACEPADQTAEAPPADIPTTPEQPADMVVSMTQFQSTPAAPELQITGMAELRSRGATLADGAELHVQISGLSEGEHAWHIHRGTCESPGEVVIPFTGTPQMEGITGNLNAGSDGRVEETVTIDREWIQRLSPNESYIVNVHLRGGEEPGPGIACANLDLSGADWGTMQPGTTQPGTTQPGTGTGY